MTRLILEFNLVWFSIQQLGGNIFPASCYVRSSCLGETQWNCSLVSVGSNGKCAQWHCSLVSVGSNGKCASAGKIYGRLLKSNGYAFSSHYSTANVPCRSQLNSKCANSVECSMSILIVIKFKMRNSSLSFSMRKFKFNSLEFSMPILSKFNSPLRNLTWFDLSYYNDTYPCILIQSTLSIYYYLQ